MGSRATCASVRKAAYAHWASGDDSSSPPRGRRPRPSADRRVATAAVASGGRSRASADTPLHPPRPLRRRAALLLVRRDDRRHRGVRLELRPRRASPGRRRRKLVRLRGRRLRARSDPCGAQPHARPAPRDLAVGPKATVAIEDRRFYQHGGVDPVGIIARSSPTYARQDRAGRLDDHAGARAQPLPLARADVQAQAHRGLSRDQAVEPLVEGEDPDRVHEPGLLRQSRVRRSKPPPRRTSRSRRKT